MNKTKLARTTNVDKPKLYNYAQIHVGTQAGVPKKPGWVRIICMGDTFGEALSTMPQCDIFIHTGNYTTSSTLEIDQFVRDLAKVDAKHKIIIPGVVEEYVLADLAVEFNTAGAFFLNGGYLTLEGIKITSAAYIGLSNKVNVFPFTHDGDVVISHYAPRGILDLDETSSHVGDAQLLDRVRQYPPQVCVFGGPAQSFGTFVEGQTMYVNCSNYHWDEVNLTFTRFGVPIMIDIPTPATMHEIKARERETLEQLGYISPISSEEPVVAVKKKHRQSTSRLPFFGTKTEPIAIQRKSKSLAHKLKKLRPKPATGGAYSFRPASSSAEPATTSGVQMMLAGTKNKLGRSFTTIPVYTRPSD